MLKRSSSSYEIQYEKTAEKFFRKHEDIRRQNIQEIAEFLVGDHPERVDVKILSGKRNKYYRMRIGDWRIILSMERLLLSIQFSQVHEETSTRKLAA